jgi:hypothetical protein
MLRASKKDDDLKVEVTGDIQGDTIKVASLKWIEKRGPPGLIFPGALTCQYCQGRP